MTSARAMTAFIGGLICVCSATDAEAWFDLDSSPSACHKYVAYPYATDCNFSGGGYRIQRLFNLGEWQNDPLGGRGLALALSPNGNLWTISADGGVWQRTGSWEQGTWTSKPLNICGTGATMRFDQSQLGQILAVATDSRGRDVPWVIDASGRARFWRTSSSLACWANTASPLPGDADAPTNIGSYDDTTVTGEEQPWAVRDNELYVYDGQSWVLIDTDSGIVQSGGPYVTNFARDTLWILDSRLGWRVDPEWDASAAGLIVRMTSGSIFGRTAVVTEHNRIWLNVF